MYLSKLKLRFLHQACLGVFFISFNATASDQIKVIETPQRLSTWLSQQAAFKNPQSNPDVYWLGMSWLSQAEIAYQAQLQKKILQDLDQQIQNNKKKTSALKDLRRWIASLPNTGRVPLPQQDPYWLEVNPAADPVLQAKDRVVIPKDPKSITVINAQGQLCTLPYRPQVFIEHYLRHCETPSLLGNINKKIMVVQADGQITRRPLHTQAKHSQGISSGSWLWSASGLVDQALEKDILELLSYAGPSGSTELDSVLKGSRVFMDSPPSVSHNTNHLQFIRPTPSDWGSVGVLQNPNARMQDEGYAGLSISHVEPYQRYSVMLQPFSWMEFGFRYTDIQNRLYGPSDFSGSQTYKDKSIDAKFLLLEETISRPALALGFRDAVGTGLFSSEYLVASKRSTNFDWSLGLAWGYMAGRQDFKNPLSYVRSGLNQRSVNDVGSGGNFSSSYFQGPVSLFGGLEYQTPWKDIILKAEFEGNNYQREPQSNNQAQKSPFNFGAVYRFGPANLTLAWERGNQVMLNVQFGGNLSQLRTPKMSEPQILPVAAWQAPTSIKANTSSGEVQVTPIQPIQVSNIGPDVSLSTPQVTPSSIISSTPSNSSSGNQSLHFGKTAKAFLEQTGWQLLSIEKLGNHWYVKVAEAEGQHIEDRIQRGIRVLHRDAPPEIIHFRVIFERKSLQITELNIDRQAWSRSQTELVSKRITHQAYQISDVTSDKHSNQTQNVLYLEDRQRHQFGVGLGYRQTLGGPDSFLLYSLSAQAKSEINLWSGAWINSSINYRLLDNYDKFQFGGTSDLPRVRTHIREYLTSSNLTLSNLQINQAFQTSPNQYLSIYGGYLESMFGGVGAEWLYRPQNGRVALGVDINRVQQRDFNQNFGFRDYSVTTGHFTQYWDTGWENLIIKTSIGQYLAGDRGVTLDLSRQFDNGVRIGAFATKTNVSSAQFGEGSFDKGIYINVPFDVFFTKYSNSDATLLWTPLTRDGGAKLYRSQALYEMTHFKNSRLYRKLYD